MRLRLVRSVRKMISSMNSTNAEILAKPGVLTGSAGGFWRIHSFEGEPVNNPFTNTTA